MKGPRELWAVDPALQLHGVGGYRPLLRASPSHTYRWCSSDSTVLCNCASQAEALTIIGSNHHNH